MLRLLLSLLPMAFLLSCGQQNDNGPDDGPPPSRAWELVWSDEFDGAVLDTTKWEVQIGDGLVEGIPNGWGNNELQYYTEDSLTVDSGNLIITARADNPIVDPAFGDDDSYTYSSGRIRTQGKFDFTYGRIEARIKTSTVQGLWPAFWLLGTEPGPYGGWAAKGEIDIMEAYKRGVDDTSNPGNPILYEPFISGAAHFGGPFPFNVFTTKRYEIVEETGLPFDPADDFHIYAVEWDAEEIRWFVDGINFFSLRADSYWNYYYSGEEFGFLRGGPSAPFDADQHIILNMAVGGNLPLSNPNPEPPVIDDFPAEMMVDYVRVYKCPFDLETGVGCKNQIDQTEEFIAFEADPNNGFSQFQAIYSEGPVTLPSGRELALVEDDPSDVLTLTEVPDQFDGEPFEVLEIVSTGSGGRFSIRDASQLELILIGIGAASDDDDPSNDFITLADFKFSLKIDSSATDSDAILRLFMATDSGESWVDIPFSEVPQDEWVVRSYGIDRILNTDVATSEGELIDTAEIIDWLGFEVIGDARFRIGEVVFACGGPFPCGLVDGFDVYIDGVAPLWTRGIQAFDTDVGGDYDVRIGNHVQWREYDTGDPEHNTVIETRFGSTGASGVTFIGSEDGQDLTSLLGGELEFDIRVTSNPDDVEMFFKVEHGPGTGSGEIAIGDTPLNTWVTKCVSLSFLQTSGLLVDEVTAPLVLVPGPGGSGQGVIVEWDNVRFNPVSTCGPDIVPPIDFEALGTLYPIGNFEGAFTQVIDNPEVSGINTSARVAEMVKNIPPDPTKPFGGSFIALSEPVDFANGSLFKIKTFSNRVGMEILFKLESTSSGAEAEQSLFTTVAGQWEEFSIDFTGKEAADLDRLTIIIDPAIAGDGSADYTLLFDDITQESSTLVPAELPLTFDDPGLAYPLTDFLGASTTVVADPEPGGTRGQVAASFFAGPGFKEAFAGTIMSGPNGFDNPLPIVGTDVVIKMDVYSPRPGVTVQLKVENALDPFTSNFNNQVTTTSGAWEEMIFTIENLDEADTFEKLIVFFDLGTTFVIADETWYWDNVEIVTP